MSSEALRSGEDLTLIVLDQDLRPPKLQVKTEKLRKKELSPVCIVHFSLSCDQNAAFTLRKDRSRCSSM